VSPEGLPTQPKHTAIKKGWGTEQMKNSFIAVAAISATLFIASRAAAGPFACNGTFSGATYQDVVVPAGDTCTLSDTRITGNVTVQTGGSFFVNTNTGLDTTIAGNVTGNHCSEIDLESTSILSGRIVVGGNFSATNCTGGGFDGGRGSSFSPPTPPPTLVIGGSVKCDNNPGGCVFDYAFIGGSFECSGNSSDCELETDAVGGNATLMGNGNTQINGGAIGGNVSCSGNSNCDLNSEAIGKSLTLTNNGTGSDVSNSAISGGINCTGNTGGVSDASPNTITGNKSGQCSAF
jgi:hypothetical protein